MREGYPSDLRDRVVAFVEAGGWRGGAARRFGVSDRFAVKLFLRSKRFCSSLPARQVWKGKLTSIVYSWSALWTSAGTPCPSWRRG